LMHAWELKGSLKRSLEALNEMSHSARGGYCSCISCASASLFRAAYRSPQGLVESADVVDRQELQCSPM
jgi:hypothetical protein